MKPTRNIFLIGPMGTGKTTVGRFLAKSLNRPFFDSDHEIERRTGVNIPLIFEYEGEPGFRQREQAMLQELTERNGIVLATGGGAVLCPENRMLLSQRGIVIYLKCSIARQLERTRKDTHRPVLSTENPRQRLETLMRIREPLYRSIADHIIDTGQRPSHAVVKAILKVL